jgi:MATE family multidrug resistance protein
MRDGLADELRHILRLALPVMVAEIGWMFMGVVDTLMVGPLGPRAIAAVSVGNAAYDPLACATMGLLLGLDTLVSQAFGARHVRECHRWLWYGLYLAAIVTPPGVAVLLLMPIAMRAAGVNTEVVALATPYLHASIWSLAPLLVYASFRRYLQGIGSVRPVMFALVTANLVNAAGNWLLIGPYGVAGVGWATCAARVYMAAVLVGVALVRTPDLLRLVPRPDPARLRELFRLGTPAATQLLLEIGVFAVATVLVGRLAPEALAAHQIVLSVAATTFMVPLGLSAAAAVAVGQAIGRDDPPAARRAGWLSLAVAATIMLATSIVFFTAPGALIRLFTSDEGVLRVGVPLFYVAAVWQIGDGLQVVATGVLRGVGNTRTPMLANLVAHWAIGLPVGWVLCFVLDLGAPGLWTGLSLGLIGTAILLVVAWSRAAARLVAPTILTRSRAAV